MDTYKIRLVRDGGRFFADPASFPADTSGSRAQISIEYGGSKEVTFPVFAQGAMGYPKNNEYLRDHGCACCSLTTLLAAGVQTLRGLTPDRTPEEAEKAVFPEAVWEENYSKPAPAQSPVTLKGISEILMHFGIDCDYVPRFRRAEATKEIASHLEKGDPVVVETSRLRYRHGIPVSIGDRKYAGSYHTTVLLCIERDGDTVWMADSAHRAWSGSAQRLKRVSLRDLADYMFSNLGNAAPPLYYRSRATAGGYILVRLP